MTQPASDDLDIQRLALLREKVFTSMRKRHTIEHSLAWGLLLMGGAIIVFAGLVVAFVLAFISFNFGFGFSIRFWLIVYALFVVPLLIWQERRTRGGFFTLAAADVDLRRDPDSIGEYYLQRTQAHAVAFTEALLWGPRAFLAGLRSLRGIRETGLDLVLPEAADTLTLLLSMDGGVKIKDLVAPTDDPMRLMPVLKWMDQHDYIGISSKGDRVWVSSIAKKLLTADHGEAILPKPHRTVVMSNRRSNHQIPMTNKDTKDQ
jgi:hypothetical protein